MNCDIAYALWTYVLSVFGVQCVLPRSVGDLLFGWRNLFGKNASLNHCTFDVENLVVCLKTYFTRSLFD